MKPRGDYQLDMSLFMESPRDALTPQNATTRSEGLDAGMAQRSQNATYSSVPSLRAGIAGVDRTTCGQPQVVRVMPVLEAIQDPASAVLSLPRVANAFAAGEEGSALVFTQQAPQVVATCPPYQAPIYSSVAWPSEIEYQCDLFTLSQTGA